MKSHLSILVVLATFSATLLASCENYEAEKNQIKETVQLSLNNPNSYEALQYSRLELNNTEFDAAVVYYNIENSRPWNAPVINPVSLVTIRNYYTDSLINKPCMTKDMIDSIRKIAKPEDYGYKMRHTFRAEDVNDGKIHTFDGIFVFNTDKTLIPELSNYNIKE